MNGLTDTEIRLSLLWLAERIETVDRVSGGGSPQTHMPCAGCGHSRYEHIVGGDADDPQPWPCTYPKLQTAPAALCNCPDFQPLGGPDE